MEKFHIEFVFGEISVNSLWNMISSMDGLSGWFADKVQIVNDSQYVFTWDKAEIRANVVGMKSLSFIRLKWDEDDAPDTYFELRIHQLELTKDITLEITDFSDPEEKADSIFLWESQVETLKRKLGV
jgi:START-like superfamily domain